MSSGAESLMSKVAEPDAPCEVGIVMESLCGSTHRFSCKLTPSDLGPAAIRSAYSSRVCMKKHQA
jgi:hypothetical protein